MKKQRVLNACLLILLIFFGFGVYEKNKNLIKETFNVNATTREEITDELVIASFIEEITGEVIDFYSEYYSGEIAVYNYEVTIEDIDKKEPGFITIKFGVTPQIGAHNPLGYDELSFLVDSRGNRRIIDYEHIKSFEIPERFQQYIIKRLE